MPIALVPSATVRTYVLLQRRLLVVPLTAVALALAPLTSSASDKDWSFDVSPYLWVADIGLETTLPKPPSGEPSTEHFGTRISAGAMLTAEAHYRSWGVMTDFAWLRLSTEALNAGPAYSSVDLRSDFVHTSALLTYQLPPVGKLQSEVMAGARVWYVANDAHAESGALPGFAASDGKAWADPMIGGNLSYELTPHWSADLKGMIGGFDVSATIAGEVFAGVTYRFSDLCTATLGYRFLCEQYDRDHFDFNMDAQGFLLGFGFHF